MTLMVDAVMVIVVLEAILLTAFGRGSLLPNLLAGFMLLVALRLVLAGAGIPFVGLGLLAAGLAHLADLRLRFSRTRTQGD